MSQRVRVLRVIALAALPLALLAALTLWREIAENEAGVAADQLALTRAAALTIDTFLDGNLATLRSLALAPAIADPDLVPDLTPFLMRMLAANPGWDGLSIIGPDGWNVASALIPPRSANIADRPYFQQLLATGQPTISPALIDRVRGVPAVILAVPVDFPTGDRGALIASLPLARLDATLQAEVGSERLQVAVLDPEGRLLIGADPEQVRALTPLRGRPDADAVLTGQTGSRRLVRPDGVELLVAYAPVPGYGWGVLVAQPTATAFAALRRELAVELGLLGLALALVGWLGWYLGGQFSAVYQRVVRARARAEAARAQAEAGEQRAAFLAGASRELASSLEYALTLRNVAHLAVPILADWCAIDVLDEDGRVRRVEVTHADPGGADLARGLRGYPPDPNTPGGTARALRTGRAELVADVSDDLLAGITRDAEHLRIVRRIGYRSIMFVPLQARERTLGALTFATAESGRRYGPTDLALAEELAHRAALAVDNARLYQEAQDAVRARDEFLSIASHELRTPVTVIKGLAQVLIRAEQRGQLDPERLHRSLRRVDQTSDRLTAIVSDLLDIARLRTGQLPLRPEPLDLAAFAGDLAERYEEQLGDHHRLLVDLPAGTCPVLADVARLEQVLANLIDNAAKYSPDGGEICLALRPDGPGVRLEVRDQGIGLPPGTEQAIFEPFGRTPNARARQLPGLGLGLHISRQIVERLDGRIWASSPADGLGTTLSVWLPCSPAETAPERDTTPNVT